MQNILRIVSYLALCITVVPGFLVYNGILEFEKYKGWVLVGTILWFATAPFWINSEKTEQE